MLLDISGIDVAYGEVRVLWDVSLGVEAGGIVSLVGANAAGKTTLLRTISGIVRPRRGEIRFDGRPIHTLSPAEIVRLGIGHVPEGRHVFPEMTVRDNLELGAAFVPGAWERRAASLDWVCALFPRLRERLTQKAGTMSGGEQQMLAVGRALMGRPRLLLVDEPSAGLSPLLTQTVLRTLREVNREGVTVLLVEQNVVQSLKLAGRGYVLEYGRIVLGGPARDLLGNPHVRAAYLGTA